MANSPQINPFSTGQTGTAGGGTSGVRRSETSSKVPLSFRQAMNRLTPENNWKSSADGGGDITNPQNLDTNI
jgi:hypothetical protein